VNEQGFSLGFWSSWIFFGLDENVNGSSSFQALLGGSSKMMMLPSALARSPPSGWPSVALALLVEGVVALLLLASPPQSPLL